MDIDEIGHQGGLSIDARSTIDLETIGGRDDRLFESLCCLERSDIDGSICRGSSCVDGLSPWE